MPDDASLRAREIARSAMERSVSHVELGPEMLATPDMTMRRNTRPPPRLPLDVFGAGWARWITEAAAAAACPPDYVAAVLLAVASALIGNARWPAAGAWEIGRAHV